MKFSLSLMFLAAATAVSAASVHTPKLSSLGCKCIMTTPTKTNTDASMCLCYNKADGTRNETHSCEMYLDNVFTYCSNHHNITSEWDDCVKAKCPCNA
ncbi:hypothetical protein CLU79DRAFT_732199 [Phycomyces nitens]|nr:hypothetical protein CLU79DRAFT_732199 [Phycomyces nitens]